MGSSTVIPRPPVLATTHCQEAWAWTVQPEKATSWNAMRHQDLEMHAVGRPQSQPPIRESRWSPCLLFPSPPRGEGAPAAPLSEAQSFSTFRCQVRRFGCHPSTTQQRPSIACSSPIFHLPTRKEPQSAKHPRHPTFLSSRQHKTPRGPSAKPTKPHLRSGHTGSSPVGTLPCCLSGLS